MLGLEMLTGRGVLVKVNSVLIPGVNDEHLIEVNRQVKARGAFLHNIMPLISDPAHGTFFGLNGQRGPTPQELKKIQDACEGGARLMRHCRQCRADAVGMLGEDRGQEFALDLLPENIEIDFTQRDAYRVEVEHKREARRAAKSEAGEILAASAAEAPLIVAVATKGDGVINEHFGHAKEFQIYEVNASGVRFVSHRRIQDHYCQGGLGEDFEPFRNHRHARRTWTICSAPRSAAAPGANSRRPEFHPATTTPTNSSNPRSPLSMPQPASDARKSLIPRTKKENSNGL